MIDEKDEELIECDSLILSVGYYPEIDLIRSLNVDIKTINTVEDGFFACGTVKHGVEGEWRRWIYNWTFSFAIYKEVFILN